MADTNVLNVEAEASEAEKPTTEKATGDTVKISDNVELAEYQDNSSFTVPAKIRENGPVNPATGEPRKSGEKYIVKFTYGQAADAAQAEAVAKAKDWTLLQFVNETLKSQARAAAYQRELATYRESEMTPETAKERMIRIAVLQGKPEAEARAMVEALFGK